MVQKMGCSARHSRIFAAAISLALAFTLAGCNSEKPKPSQYLNVGSNKVYFIQLSEISEFVEVKDGSIIVEPFEIDLVLSDKALRALESGGETIVLAFRFYGDPKTSMSDANKRFFSDCYGFSVRREFPVQNRFSIADLEIPADFYAPLADKDIAVNLNVISGRKSSPNNLLRCDILEGKLSELAGRRFFLTGKLIRE